MPRSNNSATRLPKARSCCVIVIVIDALAIHSHVPDNFIINSTLAYLRLNGPSNTLARDIGCLAREKSH